MKKAKEAKKEAVTQERFVVIAENILTDRKTGLEIIQDPTLLGEKFKEIMTHEEAQKACATLDFGGHKDWRLPTVEELCGMVDRTKQDPCYDTKIFKGKFDNWYWSSELCAWRSGAAWCVFSYYGSVSNDFRGSTNYVRPVRSSQSQFNPLPVR